MAKLHIWNMKRMNPDYEYRFYDDDAIEKFIADEFNQEVLKQYQKITIGAAKADFFRYAILLKKGGVYLDIDSRVTGRLSEWINNDDKAIISKERNPGLYVQWALVYEKGHPFLRKVLDAVIENIKANKYPNNVLEMTGPNLYSRILEECFQEYSPDQYQIFGVDYKGKIKFKYWLSGLSFRKKEHWRQTQKQRPILKE
jgi:inositol phosphorylceramide mannosyltransferase catalytic subunit